MPTSHVTLSGTNRVPLPGSRVLGPASPDEWVEVTVKLKRKAPLDVKGRPKKPMTRKALEQQFGASQADIDKVTKVLESNGLEILKADPATRSVQAAGPTSTMEKVFDVRLIRYAHERGDYRGRVGQLQIPQELDGIVEGVFGLDNRRVVKRRGVAGTAPALKAAKPAARPWFFPAELAAAYNFPPGDGAGQSIGILEFGGGYFPSDLSAFCAAAKVQEPNVIPISVDGTPTDQTDGAEGEVMLDIEVVAGVCPKATIPVYFSSFTEKGWIDILDAAIHDADNSPSILSVSWGDAEDNASWTGQAISQVNESLKEATALQITVCVAAGDDGSDDQVGDGHAHVDFPASSPFVLAVGGTTLRKRGGTFTETTWKDGDGLRKDGGGSTGGGVSVIFDKPSWQTQDIPSVNPGAKPGRIVPDVAADASAHTGYFMVVDGKPTINGGTSSAAPLWAAFLARINASLPAGKRAGYVTPLLYETNLGTSGCNDITKGDNITAAVGGYSAGTAYDAVTGWGSPNGTAFLNALQPLI
jgi:kumamolisin